MQYPRRVVVAPQHTPISGQRSRVHGKGRACQTLFAAKLLPASPAFPRASGLLRHFCNWGDPTLFDAGSIRAAPCNSVPYRTTPYGAIAVRRGGQASLRWPIAPPHGTTACPRRASRKLRVRTCEYHEQPPSPHTPHSGVRVFALQRAVVRATWVCIVSPGGRTRPWGDLQPPDAGRENRVVGHVRAAAGRRGGALHRSSSGENAKGAIAPECVTIFRMRCLRALWIRRRRRCSSQRRGSAA
ncbi:hypothetical protein C8Q79DRAFT_510023 [Trametes meyenii]|nr:hypothetical protein C8Q79DRAFT_510023 [Trametes meyenii]